MNRISLVAHYPTYQCLTPYKDGLIGKDSSSLYLLEKNSKAPLAMVNEPLYGKKGIVSPDLKFYFLISTLFCDKAGIYSLPSLHKARVIKGTNGQYHDYFKDACFTSDSHYLFLLADNLCENAVETVLYKIDLTTFVGEVFFRGEKRRFDNIRYVKGLMSLVLFDKKGKVSFFNQNSIKKELDIDSFNRLFFIDNSSTFITDSATGINLHGHNGTLLKSLSFLVSKDNEEESFDHLSQSFIDMTISKEKGLLFYVTEVKPGFSYHLFVFDLHDFSLVKDISLKEKTTQLNYMDPYLILKTEHGISLYEVFGKDLKDKS
ncbi:MAG: hypothetical protein WCS80_04290 [Bacilli bacterium]